MKSRKDDLCSVEHGRFKNMSEHILGRRDTHHEGGFTNPEGCHHIPAVQSSLTSSKVRGHRLCELFPSFLSSKLELVFVQLVFQVRVIICHVFERACFVHVPETLN